MSTEFTPKHNAATFRTRVGNCTGLNKAVQNSFKGHAAIANKDDAMRLYANAWDRFVELYEIPEKEEDITAVFEAIGDYAHHIIKENNFASVIPAGNKMAMMRLKATCPNYGSDAEESTEETAETSPKPSNGKANPPKQNGNGKRPASRPNGNGTPSATSPKGKGKSSAPAEEKKPKTKPEEKVHTPKEETPVEEKKPSTDQDTKGTAPKEEKKKTGFKRFAAGFLVFLLGAVIGAFCIAGYGMLNGGLGRTNSGVTTIGTSTQLESTMISFSGSEFLLTDLDKSQMTVAKSVITANGVSAEENQPAIRVALTRTEVSTENGLYLCYKGCSANTFVEIMVPLYPDGNTEVNHYMSYDEALAARDEQFSEVEITWGSSFAYLNLVSMSKPVTYMLGTPTNK